MKALIRKSPDMGGVIVGFCLRDRGVGETAPPMSSLLLFLYRLLERFRELVEMERGSFPDVLQDFMADVWLCQR
jgi:hypothetical protein